MLAGEKIEMIMAVKVFDVCGVSNSVGLTHHRDLMIKLLSFRCQQKIRWGRGKKRERGVGMHGRRSREK